MNAAAVAFGPRASACCPVRTAHRSHRLDEPLIWSGHSARCSPPGRIARPVQTPEVESPERSPVNTPAAVWRRAPRARARRSEENSLPPDRRSRRWLSPVGVVGVQARGAARHPLPIHRLGHGATGLRSRRERRMCDVVLPLDWHALGGRRPSCSGTHFDHATVGRMAQQRSNRPRARQCSVSCRSSRNDGGPTTFQDSPRTCAGLQLFLIKA